MTWRVIGRSIVCGIVAVLLSASRLSAQTSTGTISGVVRDQSGNRLAHADVIVVSMQTGVERRLLTSDDGQYAAPFLLPGTYLVRADRPPIHSTPIPTLVQVGMTSVTDLVVAPSTINETMTVTASGRLRDDHYQIGGWITRQQVERQPLNGRNVLEMVKVEPGLNPVRASGNRFFVAALGAGLNTIPRIGFTRVTLDGGNIETPGTVGILFQLSPDFAEQIQVSTADFDASIGLSTGGAIDVVSRSGTNSFRGSVFSLYRDRHWSDSLFWRQQTGGTIGGPLRVNHAFFFGGYERHDTRDVLAVQIVDAALQGLQGSFISPYEGTLVNARVDLHLSNREHAFVKYTDDANHSFLPGDGFVSVPSGWSRRKGRVRQGMASLTSILGTRLVNDLRVSWFSSRGSLKPADEQHCPPPCFGLDAPRIILSDGGLNFMALGAALPSSQTGARIQTSEALAWHTGPHLLRVGVDWEHISSSIVAPDAGPVTLTLWTPGAVLQEDPSLFLPATIESVDDLLLLPLKSFKTSVGSDAVMQRGFQPVRRFDMFRLHAADRWSLHPRLSVNAGAAWSIEPHVLNDDLRKPDWLAPLVGADGLAEPRSHPHLEGGAGLTWKATGDGRTLIRAGAGRYVEPLAKTVALNLANERIALSPLGTSRLTVSGSNYPWNGVRLDFQQPTSFTGADLLAILPDIRATLAQSLNPANRDFSVLNLDVTKEGRNLYDPAYTSPHALHATVGVERELWPQTMLGVDVVWKRFSNTFINGIDYNRFLTSNPVIPRCVGAERGDVHAACSNGSLFFDTTTGRARYFGALVRFDTRFRTAVRLLVSYAIGSFVGTNGTATGTSETSEGRVTGFNNDDRSENFGPVTTDIRHVLNMSGSLGMPWKMQLSFNVSASSRPPFSAYVGGMDFNGDGTINDLLPGTRVNQFNRGLTRSDLERLVADYNDHYAGLVTLGGQPAPFVTLPADFSFNDTFCSVDIRIARTFSRVGGMNVSLFGEVFNIFNTANLLGYSGDLSEPLSFGQPSDRVGQTFGSGGPRAAQLGVRLTF